MVKSLRKKKRITLSRTSNRVAKDGYMDHGKRPLTLHPRTEDRGRDRVRETRARSRAQKRARRGMVGQEETERTRRGAKSMTWKMNAGVSEAGASQGSAYRGAGAHASGSAVTSAEEPLTDELLHELLTVSNPIEFTEAHNIGHRTLSEYLNQLLAEKGLRRADVVREAGINETFGYQIFKGQRNPTRDKVLQLAFALGCDLIETNRLLKAAGANELYCKDRRDAIILFCIDRGMGLTRTDEELYRFGEETLVS